MWRQGCGKACNVLGHLALGDDSESYNRFFEEGPPEMCILLESLRLKASGGVNTDMCDCHSYYVKLSLAFSHGRPWTSRSCVA